MPPAQPRSGRRAVATSKKHWQARTKHTRQAKQDPSHNTCSHQPAIQPPATTLLQAPPERPPAAAAAATPPGAGPLLTGRTALGCQDLRRACGWLPACLLFAFPPVCALLHLPASTRAANRTAPPPAPPHTQSPEPCCVLPSALYAVVVPRPQCSIAQVGKQQPKHRHTKHEAHEEGQHIPPAANIHVSLPVLCCGVLGCGAAGQHKWSSAVGAETVLRVRVMRW